MSEDVKDVCQVIGDTVVELAPTGQMGGTRASLVNI